MRLRILTTALAATLAVAGLAGCRTNVGVAARVGGERITESDVNGYVTPTGVPASVAAQQKAASQTAPSPRSQALQYLIQEKIFKQTLAYVGVRPTAGELAAAHDPAAQLLLSQVQLTGAALDNALRKQVPNAGLRPKFVATFLRVQELEYILIQKRQLKQLSELLALVKKAKITVSVSQRYGTWSPSSLSLDGKPVIPSYLSVQPLPGAQPQPAG